MVLGCISDKYDGTAEERSFSFYKSSYFFNTTVLKIKGKVEEDENGKSIIRLKFMLAENLFVFSIVLFLALLSLSALTLINTPEFWLKFTPLLFMAILYLFISIPFYLLAQDAKAFLIQILKAEERQII